MFGRLLDAVYVPSRDAAHRLAASGVSPERIRILPGGALPESRKAHLAAMLAGATMAPPRPVRQRRARAAGSLSRPLERGAEG